MSHPDGLSLRWSGSTDRGKFRSRNEDAFLCVQFDAREFRYLGKTGEASTASSDFVFAVSDGMGGALAGEFASKIAVSKIAHLLPRSFEQSAAGLPEGFQDVLEELFTQIHRALLYLGASDQECADMGATLSLCWFTPGWMRFGHIGDSRIYHLPGREGGIRQVTQDDTHVGWLYRQGAINERQARTHPRRHILQKALGAGHQFVDPQVGAISYEPGDLFLICSDGLIDGLYDSNLLEFLRSPAPGSAADPAQRLVQEALERATRDNTTALVIEVC